MASVIWKDKNAICTPGTKNILCLLSLKHFFSTSVFHYSITSVFDLDPEHLFKNRVYTIVTNGVRNRLTSDGFTVELIT